MILIISKYIFPEILKPSVKFGTKNRLFLRPQLSLKSKTITNHQQLGCLVYPEIPQKSERSL